MIQIENGPWRRMLEHARATYPNECCGAMLGSIENGSKVVKTAMPLDNVSQGSQRERYELRPEDLLHAEREARRTQMDLVGIYHSHPDCGAYFSQTDLKNSCPWYSFVVLSIQKGEFDHANSWLPNAEQTAAEKEELILLEVIMAKVLIPTPLRQFAGKQDAVELTGATVGEVLTALTGQYQELRRQLYSDEGKLRSFVNVYVNDEDIRYLNRDSTPVKDGDVITIVPSIAGGATVQAPPQEATLSKEEILRYSRHLIMPEVGMDGQLKLKKAKVLLVGTGGLGAPLGMYLAAAGVGRIGLVDFDVVDYTNLQRQVIHGTKDVGRKKLDSAIDTMTDINPLITLDRHEVALTSENALEILKDYDLVVDGTDNFPTRYLVNDACVILKKPNVYGSIFRFEGQATVFAYEGGPCYRCLYPEPPPPGLVPSCAEGGVLGVLPGVIGLIQATEAVKLILGVGEPLVGRLLLYDALAMRFRELKLRKNPECPVCGAHPTVTKLIDYQEFCGIPQHEPAPAPGVAEGEIDPVEVKAKIDRGDRFVLIDVREPHEWQICNIPGAKLIPLGELPKRVNELNSADEIVAHCKSGIRSGKAVDFLKQAGFRKVRNMKGGILAWSDKVDPRVPKY